jgi:hypothetical protein
LSAELDILDPRDFDALALFLAERWHLLAPGYPLDPYPPRGILAAYEAHILLGIATLEEMLRRYAEGGR